MNKTLLMMMCVAITSASTGCRSMPGRNMFGLRSQPSAEALAGNGPTTTYPAPPSDSATPEAIASIAGGTSAPNKEPVTKPATTAQVAGLDISPGYATPASNTQPTNMAAAQANGIYGSNGPGSPDQSVATASGYTFGSKALTPKTGAPKTGAPKIDPPTPESIQTPAVPSAYTGGASYAGNSSYPTPNPDLTTPSTSYTPPTASSYATRDIPPTPTDIAVPEANVSTPSTLPVSASPSTVGYAMPTDAPAIAAITPSTSDVGEPQNSPENAFAPPAAVSPDFSTASAADSIGAPSSVKTPMSTSPSATGGYMPGSTSADHGYPTGDVESTSGGSFYR